MSKTIIISGGTKGLGLSLTKRFIGQGYNVATFSKNLNDEISSLCDSKEFYWEEIDALNSVAIKNFVKNVIFKFEKIDILINNVGFLYEGLLSFTKDEMIDKTIDRKS